MPRRLVPLAALCSALSLAAAPACAPPVEQQDGGVDAGIDRFAGYGEPFDAERGAWTTIPFEEARCGDDSPVSLLVNRGARDDLLVVYLEGGGACWDQYTCLQQETAAFVKTGIPDSSYEQWKVSLGGRGLFDRGDPDNPFAEASFVYVPYCTGDLHAGSVRASYGVHHVGYENVGHFLHRVVPSFPDVQTVVLAGASAGGFGAMLNYARVREAFLGVPVRVLVDSAPPLSTSYVSPQLQERWRTAWNLDAVVPEGCASCEDLQGTLVHLLEQDATLRVGILSSLEDETLRTYLGFGRYPPQPLSAAEYTAGLVELLERLDPYETARVYYVPGAQHVFVYDDPLGSTSVHGITLTHWLRGLLGETAEERASFDHVMP